MQNTMNWFKGLSIYLKLPSIPSTKQGSAEYNIKITDIGTMIAIKVVKTRQMHTFLDLTLYTRELLNSIIHSSFLKFIGVGFMWCDNTFFISLSTYSTQVHHKTIIQAYKKMLFLKYKLKQRTLTKYCDCVIRLSTCVRG